MVERNDRPESPSFPTSGGGPQRATKRLAAMEHDRLVGRAAYMLTFCLTAGWPAAAQCANWLQLQGNEPPDAPAVRFTGFLQPTYTYVDADPIAGLQGSSAANNGRHIVPNLNWPQLTSPHQFQFMRAVAGVRGAINDKINYLIAMDAGKNGVTYYRDVVLTDASLTFNHIPGARIRVGLFKPPTSEEALLAVNVSEPYVYYSNAVQYLLIGLPVEPTGSVNPTGISAARLVDGFSGYRDWGVQVYDWFTQDAWELSYAAMLSNGYAIEKPQGKDGNKDLTLRIQASRIFGGRGPNREDLSVFAWRQDGTRRFGSQDFPQDRSGFGFKYLRGQYRLGYEYLAGTGMIVAGPTPPFPENPFAVGVNEKANGWYVDGGWRFRPDWELNLRYDYFDFMSQVAANEREFPTTTVGIRHFFDKNTVMLFNYEWRRMKVSNPEALAAGAQRDNALAIAANVGNRISLQLTWSF